MRGEGSGREIEPRAQRFNAALSRTARSIVRSISIPSEAFSFRLHTSKGMRFIHEINCDSVAVATLRRQKDALPAHWTGFD